MKKGRTKIFSLDNKDEGNKIVVMGWVRTFRKSKNVSFVSLNDGSTINSLQVVLDMNTFDEKIIDKINDRKPTADPHTITSLSSIVV